MKRASTLSAAFAILIFYFYAVGARARGAAFQPLAPQFKPWVTFAPTATQRQQPAPNSSGGYTLHVDAEEVVLNCTVLDNKGELVNDLSKTNFKVFEDKTLERVISLQHQDTPVSIGLLVDNSGSMRTKRAAVSSAALDLVRSSYR
jgi:hypothetical protein